MNVLKGILKESKEYYLGIKKRIQKRLAKLPKGSIKKRNISGQMYYYIQIRDGKKVKHEYLGKEKPIKLIKQIKERKALKSELKKVNEALRLLRRSEGQKRD